MKQSVRVLLVLVSTSMLSLPAVAGKPSAPAATQVIKFVQSSVGVGTREGSCWTNSIAAPRPDAWRCMVGNEIFDPCFEMPGGESLECNPEPATGKSGFRLKLTKPLPQPEVPAQAAKPAPGSIWLMKLADGTLCNRATGAMGLVDGKPTTYYCESKGGSKDENIVLLGDPDTSRPFWTVEKATLIPGANGSTLQNVKKVAVQKAWW